jgi:threonylcarbamoyladenosine tRNA methylthiotransferase MtaB
VEKDSILSRIRRLVEKGYREVCLTGIHLCSYGLDLKPPSSLLELLGDIEKIEELAKLRLSSLDPRFLIPPLLEHITEGQKICPHFHLSLQHGSDKILRLMGRRTTISLYLEILAYLRHHSPRASLGADIIVGFPGEGEEEFDQSLSFLERSPLTYFHVFPYSPRPWTAAASWPQVEEKTKKERAWLLRRLGREKNMEFRQKFLGKKEEAIVIKKRQGETEVLTSNYLRVSVPFCPKGEGEEVRVKIIKAGEKETEGIIVS